MSYVYDKKMSCFNVPFADMLGRLIVMAQICIMTQGITS